MAKGSKSVRKRGRPKKKGPDSADQHRGVKQMDELLGVSELVLEDDGEIDEQGKSQTEPDLEAQKYVSTFTEWLDEVVVSKSEADLKTLPILRSAKQVIESRSLEKGESSKVVISMEDIEDEVEFWKPSLVGYVAGANPPLHVLEGFARRLWKEEVSKVGMIALGIFIIRFHNTEMRDRAMDGDFIFFDKKPFIMKAWNATENFTKKESRNRANLDSIERVGIEVLGSKVFV